MASHHYYRIDQSYGREKEQKAGRVYINPNFQRNHSTLVPQIRSMYINPVFSHHSSTESNNVKKPKIYVNPNFVKPHTTDRATQYLEEPAIKTDTKTVMHDNFLESGKKSITMIPQNTTTVTTAAMPSAVHVAKSRYSLVRHKAIAKNVPAPSSEKVTKLKINKYKTVSIAHVKKDFETDKGNITTCRSTSLTNTEKDDINVPPRFLHSRYKLVRRNSGRPVITKINVKPVIRRQSLNVSKAILSRSTQKRKIIMNIRNFRKNNIPCPLFKKYGKCLRNLKGYCGFLHDKKHVSICRKFLKGLCHDKDCLLSHEITVKKMPTCSFYLKGMCTKEDCPYLHVKLNEKAKICADFLSGYCEKGEKCLNRHINMCPEFAVKGACTRKRCPYPHMSNRKIIHQNKTKVQEIFNQSVKNNSRNKVNKSKKIPNLNPKPEDEPLDCRYYKEVVEEGVSIEVATIKPTRCKLGALPSFIHL